MNKHVNKHEIENVLWANRKLRSENQLANIYIRKMQFSTLVDEASRYFVNFKLTKQLSPSNKAWKLFKSQLLV